MAQKGKYARSAPASGQKPPSKPAPQEEALKEAAAPEAPMTPMQKAWDLTKTILSYAIMAFSVALMLFTAFSVSSFDRNDRDILGYKFFIVRSDSMSATDFSAGDLVVIRETDPSTLQTGDIISFLSEDPATPGETFTHKIRRIETDDYGVRSFITYGTTTGIDDLYPVSASRILGKYQFSIANMGAFFAFIKSTPGYICCIGIPFLLMLFIQGGSMITSARQIYQEKEEAAEAAHQEALAAQQEIIENQRTAIRKLFIAVNSLQERVDALEKREDKPL